MSRGRPLVLTALTLVLVGLLLPAVASAQATPPLSASLFFDNPPANLTFNAATPIKINLILANVSGAPIITIAGFSSTEFWRNLYFQLEDVGTITDASASLVHGFTPFGTCHYRNSVLIPGPGIQVTPVEVLPGNFALQFTFADARTHFDLSRPGHYTVNARITFYAYDTGAIISDCNIEFGKQSLLSIGDSATLGRQEFSTVSNSLEFVIPPTDTAPPTTSVVQSPAPNGAGWNNQNATLTFTATDNSGGSGVNRIEVGLAGAQTGNQTIAGASGAVSITAQGVTTVTYHAVDNVNNAESAQSLTVRIDRTSPVVVPPAGVTVTATKSGGARGSALPALSAFIGAGAATDNLDPAPVRLTPQVNGANIGNNTLFPIGTTAVTFRFQDIAGNIGSASATVTVTSTTEPGISVSIVKKGKKRRHVYYFDLKFANTGTGTVAAVAFQQVMFKTLSGKGSVTYNTSLSPKLPTALGKLVAGASTKVRVFLNIPGRLKKFSMTESGLFRGPALTKLDFSATQTVSMDDNDLRDGEREENDDDD